MKKGLVSVIMGVHNEPEEYIRVSVDSILAQTYSDYELIIIDDGSDEQCRLLLNDIASSDQRIRLLRNNTNLGLTKTLNIGLSIARGEFIARMDADDYSMPERFAKQIAFFDNHPDIDVLGTGVVTFGDSSQYFSPFRGYSSSQAKCELFFSSTLCHPSVMMRNRFLDDNGLSYDPKVQKGQDYDLWERCSVCGNLSVMPEVLLLYRVHGAQISSTCKGSQDATSMDVIKRRLSRIGIKATEKEMLIHRLLTAGVDDGIRVSEVENWITKIEQSNQKRPIAEPGELHSNLANRFILFKIRNKRWTSIHISEFFSLIDICLNRIVAASSAKRISKSFYER